MAEQNSSIAFKQALHAAVLENGRSVLDGPAAELSPVTISAPPLMKQLDAFTQSGLWAIIAPKEFGGADLSSVDITCSVAIIAEGDSSLGQVLQNHPGVVSAIRGVPEGPRFGTSFSECATKVTDPGDDVTVT